MTLQFPVIIPPAGPSENPVVLRQFRLIETYLNNAPFNSSQIAGTTTNDSAAAGYLGEILSATKLRSAGVALSNNITADVTSKSLTAGDWDVYTQIGFTASVGTTVLSLGLSLTSATLPGTDVLFVPTSGEVWAQIPINAVTSDGGDSLYSRVSVASTTTVYAVARAAFAAGSCSAYGSIFARRAR